MSALSMAIGAAPRYAALLKSQYWTPPQFQSYTERQLEQTLKAAATIPFYAARFEGTPQAGDLSRLSFLNRSEIKALNLSVRSINPAVRNFLKGASSGSSGMPAEFLFDLPRVRGRYAARIRYLRAHGWTPFSRTIWHQASRHPDELCADFVRHRILPGFMGLSSDLAAQVERLVEIDPVYLYVYPSNLEGMIRVLERSHQRLRSLRLVFTVAEMVDDALRERAKEALGVEIADNYGTTETFIAWQCPSGSYHINAEHVLLELVDEAGQPVAPGEMGRVVITTLENYLMPLVRYDIGDYAVAAEGMCQCGRTLPRLERIVGRKFNLFHSADGRLFSPALLIEPLRLTREIIEFQLIEKTTDAYMVRYVAQQELSDMRASWIRGEFDRLIGSPVTVDFERNIELPRTKGGKFMAAISEIA
jgi:phenylacetate-CoA ligase